MARWLDTRLTPLTATLCYAALALAWVIAAEQFVLHDLTQYKDWIALLNGVVFVAFNSMAIFVLVRFLRNSTASRQQAWHAMHDLGQQVERAQDEDEVFTVLTSSGPAILRFDAIEVYLSEGRQLVNHASSAVLGTGHVEAQVTRAYTSGEALIRGNLDISSASQWSEAGYRSLLAVPIQTIGVLVALRKPPHAFCHEDARRAEVLGSYVSEAVQRIRYLREVQFVLEEQGMLLSVNRRGEGEFIITSAKGKLLTRMGYAPEEITGRSVFEGHALSDDYYQYFEQAWAGERVRFQGEYGGVYYLASLIPTTRQGKTSEILMTVTNRTGEEQTRLKLSETEERFRQVFEHSMMGIGLADARNGRFLEVNDVFCKITGYSREELINLGLHGDTVWPDTRQREAVVGRLMGNGFVEQVELDFVTRRGERRRGLGSFSLITLDGSLCILAMITDITEQTETRRLLEISDQRYRSLFNENPDAIFSLSLDGQFVNGNKACQAVLGRHPADLAGTFFELLLAPEFVDQTKQAFQQACQGTACGLESAVISPAGNTVPVEMTQIPITVDGKASGVFVVAKDVTREKEADARIRQMVHYDQNTQLPNVRWFREIVNQHLEQTAGEPTAVVVMDLDHFARFNELLGQEDCDRLLAMVATRLREIFGSGAMLARLHGDEFAVAMPGMEADDTSADCVRDLLQAMEEPFYVNDYTLHLTLCAGVAFSPDHGTCVDDLLSCAAQALVYGAKPAGSNNYCFFSPALQNQGEERLVLDAELRAAIGTDQLAVYYQPQMDLRTQQVTAVEALCRWFHPDRGYISPATFIPLAEETGFIIPLGRWVLETACQQIRSWVDAGIPPVRVAVNMSIRQFQHDDVVSVVQEAVARAGIDPSLLEIEISESIAAENMQSVIEVLRQLKDLGVRIALDDFGTGYSSLSYIKSMPVDVVKLDKAFLQDIGEKPVDLAVTRAVTQLAADTGITVVAEGVETLEHFKLVQAADCDMIQGFLVSKALPPEQVTRFFIPDWDWSPAI